MVSLLILLNKRLCCLLVVMLIWSSPATATETTKEKPLFQKIHHMGTLIDDKQWDQATVELNSLIDLYQKKKGEWYVPGDQSKYEQILFKLKRAIKEKNKIRAKLTLLTIRIMIKAIYST